MNTSWLPLILGLTLAPLASAAQPDRTADLDAAAYSSQERQVQDLRAQDLRGHADQDSDRIRVSWDDPASMAESKTYNPRREGPEDWLIPLANHLEKTAIRRLDQGEHLQVNIVDVLRAGRFEPWQRRGMDDVRILRPYTAPRLTLDYTLRSADGQVIAQGQDKLVDGAYYMRSTGSNSDPLRYEKRMIDDWMRRTLRNAHAEN